MPMVGFSKMEISTISLPSQAKRSQAFLDENNRWVGYRKLTYLLGLINLPITKDSPSLIYHRIHQ